MHVFYVPGEAHPIDYAVERGGRFVTRHTGETINQLAERYPGVTVTSEAEFHKKRIAVARQFAARIDDRVRQLRTQKDHHDAALDMVAK